jgi:hypothetical protein
MTTKIKHDNINYIKLKYEACCFTPDQNTRLVRNEDMFFFNINREVYNYHNIVLFCIGT